MLRSLNDVDVAWMLVEAAFDWSARQPRSFMTIADVCRAAGFEPTPGDGISVSGFLRRQGIERLKCRGQRGALMPPLVAKTTQAL